MDGVRQALAGGHPLGLLELVSGVLSVLTPSRLGPLAADPSGQALTPAQFVDRLLEVPEPEVSAMLTGLAALSGDDVLRRRVRRAVAEQGHALPGWLAGLHQARPAGDPVEVVHVLGDGDNIMLGVRLADGAEFTAVVYIDHNMGTLVKDAFVLPAPVVEVREQMLRVAADSDTQARPLNPADARVRITEAIELSAMTYPPLESDTWPLCRPLVEWAAAMLPAGGTGYQRLDVDREALGEAFLAGPFGSAFGDPEHRALLEALLWFGSEYGPGDPLRWSPTSVEMVLLDWVPRKIMAEVDQLALLPDLLRAFIRFSHHERGIQQALTAETLTAVDELAPEYLEIVSAPRSQGLDALVAAMTDGVDGQSPPSFGNAVPGALVNRAGGAAPAQLDTEPLPDEAFDWAPIRPDVHQRVGEVLTLTDRCCDELLDVEYRTACRRLLSRIAAADPAVLRRGRTDTAAGAVCWAIGKANGLFVPGAAHPLRVKDLAAHFRISQQSFAQRGAVLLGAIGVEVPSGFDGLDLATPDCLVSARRAEIIRFRERFGAGRF